MRDESSIFADLSTLCRSSGYIHAIAYFCFRDVMVSYSDKMTPEDMEHLYSQDHLLRTEITSLIGLMIQGRIDFALPAPNVIQTYIQRTEALLKEIHMALCGPFFAAVEEHKTEALGLEPNSMGDALREPVFYGGESAYLFQYREFSSRKYSEDNDWLISNKGFTIQAARDVVHAIQKFQEKKLTTIHLGSQPAHSLEWNLLPGFSFTVREIAELSGIEISITQAILTAFAIPPGENNPTFRGIQEFNATNATPLIHTKDGFYINFHPYSLGEALYESPFYWMWADKAYRPIASENRGRFTEEFCYQRLELVFGKGRVFSGVKIIDSKGTTAGEIDVLVLFGNRAIVLQAKSKRMTVEARKGNDGQVRDDFKKSVQDAYDQAFSCADLIRNPRFKLVDSSSQVVDLPTDLKEVYLLCLVSDHYPALNFQARQFLKFRTPVPIQAPLVLDIFTLDAMTEMLQSPLQFLSYIKRRANYSEQLHATHDLTILSYHLKKNLWVEDETSMILLADDIAADLDISMAVRRDGVKGKRTPDGILTRFASTKVGRIVKAIEDIPVPGTIDLGFLLLTLSEDTVSALNHGINTIARRARQDHKHHDLTLGIGSGTTGLTVHCNEDDKSVARPRLEDYCLRRKYRQKTNSWFGICIHPSNCLPRFGISLCSEWQPDGEMDLLVQGMKSIDRSTKSRFLNGKRGEVGRNDPCPCGSGLKYKKCCLE